MSNLHRVRTLLINNKILNHFLDNKHLVDKSQLSHLRAIQDKVKGLNEYTTTYRYLTDKTDKDCSVARLGEGRVYGEVGSPEYLDYNYRNNLFADYYWDIDMKNCHPTLLTQYAKRYYNINLTQLEEYVENREDYIQQLIEYYATNYNTKYTRSDVKDKIIAVLYGGKVGALKAISDEISNVAKIAKDKHKTLWDAVCSIKSNKIDNREGSFMAFVIQSEEVKCLDAIDTFFLFKKRSVDALAYDGLMVRKTENEIQEDVEKLLTEAEQYVKEKTGYDITLVIKPMARDIDDSVLKTKEDKTLDKYLELKEQFEKKHFFLKSTATICKTDNDNNVTQYKIQNANILFAEWVLPDNKKFISKWLLDGNKRTYDRLVCKPRKDHTEDEYNIFKDFIGSKAQGVNDPGFKRFLELLKMIVNHDEKGFEYVKKWIALLIQKPWEIPRTCLVFIGEQGVGKDTFWDFVGEKLIGAWANVRDADRDLYGSFATAMTGTFLQKLEEANPASNRSNQDKFKGFVTGNKQVINPKGMPSYEIEAYPHFVSTSNRNPFVVEQTDRRLVYWWCSSEKLGDSVFWTETYELLNDEGTVASVYNYFMNYDITGFNSCVPPETQYKEALKHDEKRSSVIFLEQYRETTEIKSSDLYAEYQGYCVENTLVAITPNKFYRDITEMCQKKLYNSRMLNGTKLITRLL